MIGRLRRDGLTDFLSLQTMAAQRTLTANGKGTGAVAACHYCFRNDFDFLNLNSLQYNDGNIILTCFLHFMFQKVAGIPDNFFRFTLPVFVGCPGCIGAWGKINVT